jgi:hypothetical protein
VENITNPTSVGPEDRDLPAVIETLHPGEREKISWLLTTAARNPEHSGYADSPQAFVALPDTLPR